MSPSDLKELKTNALALRNIASKVLELVERVESTAPARPARKPTISQIMASDLIERIQAG